jgi:MFS family permease
MYSYFIPVFAQRLGASFLNLGLIWGFVLDYIRVPTYALTPMVAGHLADRFNRVWLFSLSIIIITLATLALPLSRTVQDVALIRSATGVAFAFFWPISEVLVIDLAPKERRVREMGLYSVSWGQGI